MFYNNFRRIIYHVLGKQDLRRVEPVLLSSQMAVRSVGDLKSLFHIIRTRDYLSNSDQIVPLTIEERTFLIPGMWTL